MLPGPPQSRSPMRRQNYGDSSTDMQDMYRYGGLQTRDDASVSMASAAREAPPSSKAHGLVGEIVALETQCNWLEGRNSWLTSKLLHDRRKFIDRALMSNKRVVLGAVLQEWLGVMGELRMEHQLDEQSRSLEQCKHVTDELGRALAQEQELRKEAEDQGRALHEENRSLLAENQSMRQQVEEHSARVQILERQVQEAEACLKSSRSEAQSVLERMDAYESRKKGLDREPREAQQAEEPIERSLRMRGEAQGTMQKVQHLLPSRGLRQQSPERTERTPPDGVGSWNYAPPPADGSQCRARTPQRASRPQQQQQEGELEPAEVHSRLQSWQQHSEATASPPSGMRVPSPEPERSSRPLQLKENVYGVSMGAAPLPTAYGPPRMMPGSPGMQLGSAPQGFQAMVVQPSAPPGPVQAQMVRVPVMQAEAMPAQAVIGGFVAPPGGPPQVLEPWWAARRAASPMRVAAPTL